TSIALIPITSCCSCLIFFNAPPPPALYTLSLHDALPIFHGPFTQVHRHAAGEGDIRRPDLQVAVVGAGQDLRRDQACGQYVLPRSEEHTSELQSLTNLVCRLLLEKKKQYTR